MHQTVSSQELRLRCVEEFLKLHELELLWRSRLSSLERVNRLLFVVDRRARLYSELFDVALSRGLRTIRLIVAPQRHDPRIVRAHSCRLGPLCHTTDLLTFKWRHPHTSYKYYFVFKLKTFSSVAHSWSTGYTPWLLCEPIRTLLILVRLAFDPAEPVGRMLA